MDSEFENKPQDQSSENERTREGYNPAGGYQKSYRPVGRTQRPRINSHRAYSSDRSSSNSEGGFRPEGFGAGLQSTGSSERPQRSSYQSRGGYGNSNRGGYQPRQQEAISLVLSRVAIVLVTTIMMSRVVISLVSRVATSHVSRAATSLVLSRVVMETTVVVMVVPRVAAMATTVVVMVVLSRVVMATTVAVMAVHRVVAMATTVVAVSVSTLLVTIQMLSIA